MVKKKSTPELRADIGSRFNTGKLKPTLFSPLALSGCVKVLMYGMRKYAAWNWSKGLPIDETFDSMLRHSQDVLSGEFYDTDENGEVTEGYSGLPLVDHILCNAMFLSHFWHSGQWDELDKNMPYQYTLFDDVDP